MTAKKSRHRVLEAAAAQVEVGPPGVGPDSTQSTTARARGGAQIPANDDRKSAIVTMKGSRRPAGGLGDGEVGMKENACQRAGSAQSTTARAGGGAHIRANDDRKSVIVTGRDRKTVQRQREQQQMARIVTYVPKRQQNRFIGLEELSPEELQAIRERFLRRAGEGTGPSPGN